MAFCSREFDVPADRVFDVLVDPETYPMWLVGASRIRDVDEGWPAVGTRFHHRVGLGPFAIPDSTEVAAIVPGSYLQLAVRARPLVSAVVDFRLLGEGDRCVLTMQEEPRLRLVGNVVRAVLDPLTHVRNQSSLKRMEDVVIARAGGSARRQPRAAAGAAAAPRLRAR